MVTMVFMQTEVVNGECYTHRKLLHTPVNIASFPGAQ